MASASVQHSSHESYSCLADLDDPMVRRTRYPNGVQSQISKVLLDGLYDQNCILSHLRGCQHVMKKIWEELLIYWAQAIRLPEKDVEKLKGKYMGRIKKADEDRPQPFYLTPVDVDPDVGGYGFPVREDNKDPININMMPFIVGADFEECKLPEFVRPYWSLIQVYILTIIIILIILMTSS